MKKNYLIILVGMLALLLGAGGAVISGSMHSVGNQPEMTASIEATVEEAAEQEGTWLSAEDPVLKTGNWERKFADCFSSTVETGPDFYRSPNIAIEVTKVMDSTVPVAYFVADIHIAQLENFQTAFAGDGYRRWASENILTAAERHGAILCMNGDYADAQKTGLLIRNGELYLSQQTRNDICVMYRDGTVKTYAPDEYCAEDIIARSPWQVWKFGPALLDGEGNPRKNFNTSQEILRKNPRSGLGYYEPGHYCFIVVDGRQDEYSRGMEISRFAQLFSDLGCKEAYNLDGGQSSVLSLNGKICSKPCKGGRDSGDFLMICELPR